MKVGVGDWLCVAMLVCLGTLDLLLFELTDLTD